ncbi:hypothetical protein [Glutamicibacter sp. X7]
MSSQHNEPNNPYANQGQGGYQQQPNGYYQSSAQQPNGYYQPGAQQPYPGYINTPQQLEGAQLAQTSMILGIISLFVVGIILGPIAIVKANRAEREFNTAATVGKVTGWIGTIFGILGALYIVFLIIVLFTATSAGYSEFYDYM